MTGAQRVVVVGSVGLLLVIHCLFLDNPAYVWFYMRLGIVSGLFQVLRFAIETSPRSSGSWRDDLSKWIWRR